MQRIENMWRRLTRQPELVTTVTEYKEGRELWDYCAHCHRKIVRGIVGKKTVDGVPMGEAVYIHIPIPQDCPAQADGIHQLKGL